MKKGVQGACKELDIIMDCEPNWIKREMKIEDEGWIVEKFGGLINQRSKSLHNILEWINFGKGKWKW